MTEKPKEAPHLKHLQERALKPHGGLDIGARVILRMRGLLPQEPVTIPTAATTGEGKPVTSTSTAEKKEPQVPQDKINEKKKPEQKEKEKI